MLSELTDLLDMTRLPKSGLLSLFTQSLSFFFIIIIITSKQDRSHTHAIKVLLKTMAKDSKNIFFNIYVSFFNASPFSCRQV
jgi:hypothetical protein